MTIHHITCDLCGEVITNGFSMNGREIANGHVTRKCYSSGARHVDVCDRCVNVIKEMHGKAKTQESENNNNVN